MTEEEIAELLAYVASLPDAELWQAAQSRLSAKEARQIEELNRKQQREGLTAAEKQTSAALLHRYGHAMLTRAKAAATLKEHGHDIDCLLQPMDRGLD